MRRTVQIAGGVESLFGTLDENVKLLESALHVTTHLQDDRNLAIDGEASQVDRAVRIVTEYNQLVHEGRRMSNGDVKAMIRVATQDPKTSLQAGFGAGGAGAAARVRKEKRYAEKLEPADVHGGHRKA